jgi:hypothetical protein
MWGCGCKVCKGRFEATQCLLRVWNKLLEALADVGYDTNNMATAAFDWRLSIPAMEARDAWFTRTRCVAYSNTRTFLSRERYAPTRHPN